MSPTVRTPFAAALAAISLVTGAAAQQPADAPPLTLALLVGIDDYLQPADDQRQLGPLGGAQNDIDRVRELLIDRFGFAPATIVELLGAAASHEAIVRAWTEHLIARAGPDTQVVFWFSGHGSRVPDASGADTSVREMGDDAWDDSMLAHDSRSGDRNGCFDFTDDELHSLLAKVKAQNVLVVTDCCHSGGLLRGNRPPGTRRGALGEQPFDQSLVAPFWPKDVPLLDDDRGEQTAAPIHIAACSSLEEAGELQVVGRTFGTLTWFLTAALAEVEPGASWRQVAETVRARVAGNGTRRNQLVDWRGPVERAVLGGRGRALPPGYPVLNDPGLSIEAGRIHGIVDGTLLRAVDLDGRERGQLVVVHADTSRADLEWRSRQPPPRGVPLRAIPSAGLDGRSPLRVRTGDADAALLADCPWATAVNAAAPHDYRLDRREGAFLLVAADGSFERVVGPEPAAVQAAAFREHCFRSLWEGVARPGRYQVDIAVAPATAERCADLTAKDAKLAGPPQPAQVFVHDDRRRAVVGATWLDAAQGTGRYVELTVTNRSDEDLHVAILSVTESHQINIIWGSHTDNLLAAGRSHTRMIEVGPERTWQQPRPMIDRYLAIATPRFADFRPFAASEVAAAPEPTRGAAGPTLPVFLAGALDGQATRGGDAPVNWGITWFDLELVTVEQFAAATGR